MDIIDINDLYQAFTSYVNTYTGGWYRPQSDFQVSVNVIQNELWNDLTNQAEKSNEVKDNLRNFLRSKNAKVDQRKGGYGFVEEPKDYGRFASAKIVVVDNKTIEPNDEESDESKAQEYYSKMFESDLIIVDNARWAACLTHKTKCPTLKQPRGTQIQEGWKVAPREISSVVLDYYIKPSPVVFAYDKTEPNLETGDGDQIIYNKQQSKQLLWPSTLINEFVIRLGERYGLFTRDQFMTQYNSQKKS